MSDQNHAKALLESLTCQTCGGTGATKADCNGPRDCVGTEEGCRHCVPGWCVACDGLGVVLPDEMVEALAKARYLRENDYEPEWWELLTEQGRVIRVVDARDDLVAGLREVAE